MRKKKIIFALFATLMMSSPVYAKPTTETTSESTTAIENTEDGSTENTENTENSEDTSEETTENNSEDDTGNSSEGDSTEEITEEVTTELPEDAHGEIYNAAKDIYIIQGKTASDRVEQAIEKLNEKSDEGTVRKARLMYNSLTMAQKARVQNEHHLFEIETLLGIQYDYNAIYANEDPYVISEGSVKDTTYIYHLTKEHPNTSISLQYTVDADVDGVREVPAISIKRPDGTTSSVAKDTAEIRDASCNIMMTWASTFMQLDVASGEFGEWAIYTDTPVIFTETSYAGSKQELPAIPEDNVSTEATTEEQVDEENKTSTKSTLIKLFVLAAVSTAFFVFWSKKGKKDKEKAQNTGRSGKKRIDTDDLDAIVRSDDDVAKTRQMLSQQIANENFADEEVKPKKEKVQPQETYAAESEILTTKNSGDDFLDEFD